jgi:RimJ/RimL family protein N-acetyltransferase
VKELESFSANATLRDGRPVLVRAIRPDDRERLRLAFEQLDPRSVFLRFFGRKSALTDRELTDLTEVDFEQTVALVVTWHEDNAEQLIAGGRYIRLDDATEQGSAEVAFTVRDDHQGQGLASLLLQALIEIARRRAIARFVAEVLPNNLGMLRVFEKSGLPMRRHNRDGVVHVTLDLVRDERP